MKNKVFTLLFAGILLAFLMHANRASAQLLENISVLPLIECPPNPVFCFPSAGDNVDEAAINIGIHYLFPIELLVTKFQANRPFNKLRMWAILIYAENIPDKSGQLPPQSIVVNIYDKRPDDDPSEVHRIQIDDVIPTGLLNLAELAEENEEDPFPEDFILYFCRIDVDLGKYIDLQNGWIGFSFPTNNLFLLTPEEEPVEEPVEEPEEEIEFLNLFLPIGHWDEVYASEADPETDPETLSVMSGIFSKSDDTPLKQNANDSSIMQTIESLSTIIDNHAITKFSEKNDNDLPAVWQPYGFKPFFALSTDVPLVPLSSRALILTGILILSVVMFRFIRR